MTEDLRLIGSFQWNSAAGLAGSLIGGVAGAAITGGSIAAAQAAQSAGPGGAAAHHAMAREFIDNFFYKLNRKTRFSLPSSNPKASRQIQLPGRPLPQRAQVRLRLICKLFVGNPRLPVSGRYRLGLHPRPNPLMRLLSVDVLWWNKVINAIKAFFHARQSGTLQVNFSESFNFQRV